MNVMHENKQMPRLYTFLYVKTTKHIFFILWAKAFILFDISRSLYGFLDNLSNCVLQVIEESMFKILLRRRLLVSFLLFQIKVDLSHFQLIFLFQNKGRNTPFVFVFGKTRKKANKRKRLFSNLANGYKLLRVTKWMNFVLGVSAKFKFYGRRLL